MRLQKRSLLLTAAIIVCLSTAAAVDTPLQETTRSASVFLLEEPAGNGYIRFNYMLHTTEIYVTEGTSIGALLNSIINGINNDPGSLMTATGGGGNKIIFQSDMAYSGNVYIDAEIWVDPDGDMFSSYMLPMQ